MPIIVLGSTFGMSFVLKALYAGSASTSKRARMKAGLTVLDTQSMKEAHSAARALRAHHLEHAGAVPFVGTRFKTMPLVESDGALRGDELKADRPAGCD